MSYSPTGRFGRWAVFIAERFPPAAHAVMLGAFCTGNIGLAWVASGESLHWGRVTAAVVVVCLIFFRLRIFDEIKDVAADRQHNPQRPLARGLIGVAEAWRVALAVAAVEALCAALCGRAALTAWSLVFAFSLLMKKEFFAGAWLSPRMELYAVSHTFVAALIGLFTACTVLDRPLWSLPAALPAFGGGNWALFNVFEFARKTYAPDEEPAAETYSKRWGAAGAFALTYSQLIVAAGVLVLLGKPIGPVALRLLYVLALAIPAAVGLNYVLRPCSRTGRLFRTGMLASALATYVTVPWIVS